ncbi:lytic transglycosylase domain-containing protein [Phenylobacterium sp.]|uniref:lytic transglycosylase domain-containing protein n=1 Tax=Phenylobacterium sp. TaxID=1871053 RepID=UPI0028111E44|nr:lytic transglycosylase domain-containing protein [Phenylobacterium sp.]
MTLAKRLCLGVAALVLSATAHAASAADSPRPLSEQDARAYARAFAAADQGDFVGAQLELANVRDTSLQGYLSFRQLMHPTAHKASFEELTGWLGRFRDLPLADKVFSLANKRKPADAPPPPAPAVAALNSARSEATFAARDAFYSGDVKRAYDLAVECADRWIAGLAAYRLRDYATAQDYFAQVAGDEDEDVWLRAAGAYWAYRAATNVGDPIAGGAFLRRAAQAPHTFYGMLAARQVQLTTAATGEVVLASYRTPAPAPASHGRRQASPEIVRFIQTQPRAHRAAALVQIGRMEDARQELRVGLALARTAVERDNWKALIAEITPGSSESVGPGYLTLGDYPLPTLEPKDGFTVDRALVYAIVRQESRFNPQAISPVGAIGLMQLMPTTAALTTGDDKFKADYKPLLDPATNLRIGQDYIAWLTDRGVGYDLLRVVAAYNGGPGAVQKALRAAGDNDPLMLIESLPALETRDYVEKVVAGYWAYKRLFGEDARSLDALATGARTVDLRLDLPNPQGPQPQLTTQALQVGVLKTNNPAARD